jgi:mannose-6-phosphate isomerase-like protein (cupin superfamily)
MPVITAASAARFDPAPGTGIVGLASPSRGSQELSAWRVRLDPGVSSPAHEVDREEVFVVLEGRVRVTYEDHAEEAEAGGALVVPTGREFTLTNPGPDAFEAVVCAPAAIRATAGGETFPPPWAA